MGDLDRRAQLLKLIETGAYYAAHECGAPPWKNEYEYPVSPPPEIDCLNLYGKGGDEHHIIATSARVVTIAHEIDGGELGTQYGIAVAKDGRERTEFVMGGGQVAPDIRDDPPEDDLAAESIRECAVREVLEELKIEHGESDLLLFGVRTITEEGTRHPRMRRGRMCADVCFLAIIEEPLKYAEGLRGEAGERSVKSVAELVSSDRNSRTGLLKLPASQALVLATAIVYAEEMLGDAMPEPLKQVVRQRGTIESARNAIPKNVWRSLMIPVIQIGAWKGIDLL